jgi:enoyl-CoA hydratase
MEPWVLMNFKRANEYLYLGETLTPEEAKEWGFINEVVPRADLESMVEEMAATISQMPLTTIMTIKQSVKRAREGIGMRVNMQNTADFCSLASGATDVHEFMAKRAGRRPRQVAEDGAQAVKAGDA